MLRAISGPLRGMMWDARSGMVLGRGDGCDVDLPLQDVSRRHARIVRMGEGWAISDIGSTNGIQVRGKTVQWQRLAFGDVFSIAGCELRLERGASTQALPERPARPRPELTAARPSQAPAAYDGDLVGDVLRLRRLWSHRYEGDLAPDDKVRCSRLEKVLGRDADTGRRFHADVSVQVRFEDSTSVTAQLRTLGVGGAEITDRDGAVAPGQIVWLGIPRSAQASSRTIVFPGYAVGRRGTRVHVAFSGTRDWARRHHQRAQARTKLQDSAVVVDVDAAADGTEPMVTARYKSIHISRFSAAAQGRHLAQAEAEIRDLGARGELDALLVVLEQGVGLADLHPPRVREFMVVLQRHLGLVAFVLKGTGLWAAGVRGSLQTLALLHAPSFRWRAFVGTDAAVGWLGSHIPSGRGVDLGALANLARTLERPVDEA